MIEFGIFLLILVILLLFIIYYYVTKNFDFWKSRNISGPQPVAFFGTIKNVIFRQLNLGFYIKNVYDLYPDEPMVGIFDRNQPVLIIKNLELIKTIMIKDFKYFMIRDKTCNDKVEPLSAHLILLEAKRWRQMRTKLTPVFTSGKLKGMFDIIVNIAEKLNKYLETFHGKMVDVKEISSKFTIDTIGACTFGLESNALKDENSIFRKMVKRESGDTWKNAILFTLKNFMPGLYNLFGRCFVDKVLEDFFINLTKDTMEYRQNNNINRHDFVDLLLALKNKDEKIDDIELTDSLLAAQLFVFFIVGYEMSALTISNFLLELAINPDIQNKVRNEIQKQLEKTNGTITYNIIKEMTYLNQVYQETLRKYPPVMFVTRKTIIPYTLLNTKVTLPAGSIVWIPIYAIQRDPKYFPDPDVFDPERFNDEEIKKRPPMTYLPFGDGPRNCIGSRFGIMQTKVGLIKILQNYTVNICEKTEQIYEVNHKSVLLVPKNGTILQINKHSSSM